MKLNAGVISKNSSPYIIYDLSEIEELSEEKQQGVSGGIVGAIVKGIVKIVEKAPIIIIVENPPPLPPPEPPKPKPIPKPTLTPSTNLFAETTITPYSANITSSSFASTNSRL